MAGFGVTDEGFFDSSFVCYSVNEAIPNCDVAELVDLPGMERGYGELNSSILNLFQPIAAGTPAGVGLP
jgi:hypothetical protein